jgi:hypothetical protein
MSSFDLIKEWELPIAEVHSKYVVGKKTDAFEDIKYLKPLFSFDYVSIRGSDFCFDGKLISRKDLIKLIKSMKDISTYSYETLNKEYRFHFHEVNWNNVTLPESSFYKCIYGDKDVERTITPYQFKVYDKARVIGFIYKGVFYLVMFDRNHKAYKRE